jgi:integrase
MTGALPRNLVLRGDVYYVRLMLNGRRIWRSTGHTTLKSAIRKADEMKVGLRNDRDFGKGETPFFTAWVKDYLATYTVKKKAAWRDEQILTPALPFFGRYRLDEVTRSLCVRYLNKRGAAVAPSTLNRERGLLQSIFERAKQDGLISSNPWKGIAKERERPRIRVLTVENEQKLRAVLSERWQRWLTFMLGTGLRLAEARTITEMEVDFDRQLINVPEEGAKGGKPRQVPLFPEVAAAIRAELQASERLWHANPQWHRDTLQAKAIKAGIPHLSPHDLRHTFATRYLRGGGNIYTLSKILGHSSVTMTEKQYVHLLPTDIVEMSKGVDLGLTA